MVLEIHGSLDTAAEPVVFLGGLEFGSDWSFYPHLLQTLGQHRPVIRPVMPPACPLSREYGAINDLFDALAEGSLPFDLKSQQFGVFGHAKGASLALLLSAKTPAVCGAVAISPLCTFNRLADSDSSIQDDIGANKELFDLELAVRSQRCEVVVIGAEEDHIAPIDEAECVFHWAPKGLSSLVLLEKTGHSLGSQHPFDGSNKELDRVLKICAELFDRVFARSAGDRGLSTGFQEA